jgi:hypothetical protein
MKVRDLLVYWQKHTGDKMSAREFAVTLPL